MKLATIALAGLMAAAPLIGQASPGKKWSFGVYGSTPDLGMYLRQRQSSDSLPDLDSLKTDFDSKTDLALKSGKMGMGTRIDYLGPRGGFQLDVGVHEFAGQNKVTRPIVIDNQTFSADADVTSSIKNTTVDLTGTIKILRFEHFWFGIDLGIQAWMMQVSAEAKNISSGGITKDDPDPVSANLPLPIPQVGLSFGIKGFNNVLEIRGRAHMLGYSGATYTLFAADARCYFLPWLGVRAFMENQQFDAPYGSVSDDLEARIDNNRFGFGIAFRW